jgi:MoaA/NifB/PqqE/SkfB family radical SAM enzyme
VEIEVINRCNIKPACDYCYAGPFDGKTIELEDLKFVISKTERQVSPFEVIFLGGEPFLRSDMVDILEFAKITFSTHLLSMSTNGTMLKTLSEDKLARLRALSEGNPLIQVSIDSTRNPTVQKSLRSLEGIMVLEKHDIPFNIGIVITRRNLHNYLETLDDLLKFPHLMGINAESLQKTSEPYYNQNRLTLEEEYLVVPSIEKLAAERSRTDVYIVNSNKNHCLFQMIRH